MKQSRTEQRKDFGAKVRIQLLEGDMDEREEKEQALSKLMVGMLVSLATAATLVAIDIALKALGG